MAIFKVLGAQSWPASSEQHYNDDAYGSHAHMLWVIDGATGVSNVRHTRHASDAAWLAQAASQHLAQEAPSSDLPLYARLQNLERQLGDAFARERTHALTLQEAQHAPVHSMPSACLGVVQLHRDGLEIACVGDVSIVVETPGHGIAVYSDHASTRFSERTMHAWQAAKQQALSHDAIWDTVRPVILENRKSMNTADGYRVVHPTLPWTVGLEVVKLPLVAGMRVLLASDGLWRLVDVYAQMTPEALLHAVATRGLAAVLNQLRELEAQDPSCLRYARIKPSDDATALLAEVLPDAEGTL